MRWLIYYLILSFGWRCDVQTQMYGLSEFSMMIHHSTLLFMPFLEVSTIVSKFGSIDLVEERKWFTVLDLECESWARECLC